MAHRGYLATHQSRSRRLHPQLVDVAPDPVFAGLVRPDQRVLGSVEVLRGMPVLRLVAAADMAAAQAQSQVDPGVAGLQALLAAIGVRGDVSDLVQVRALDRHLTPSALDEPSVYQPQDLNCTRAG